MLNKLIQKVSLTLKGKRKSYNKLINERRAKDLLKIGEKPMYKIE